PHVQSGSPARPRAAPRLAILSNELDLFYGKSFRERLPLLSLFETIVDATYTKVLKPDRRAYAMVSEALKLPLSACVFVDDQKRNIDGAVVAGMLTVHFDVAEPARSYAEALGHFGLAVSQSETGVSTDA
ncbi:MAG: HAD family phosphatase, partial [Mesorhizobium sp.]